MNSGDDSNGANSDPAAVLEKHGCTVFLPDQRQNKLDWDYLAGYQHVKRSIEDTILLALTNRPKCVLFEGPPGCGKTTSAKIISY